MTTWSDVGWSSGLGALVRGPAEALMLAIGGRAVAVDDLTGEGVVGFQARF